MTVEYYISLIIFASFIAYLAFQLIKITPNFMNALRDENLRIEAYKLSELLVNDPGEPIDWNVQPQVKRIGLSSNENKTNLLSREKIIALQSKCSINYAMVRRLLATEYNFSLVLKKTSGETLAECKPTITPYRGTNVTISRIVALDDNSMGELILYVW